MMIELLVHLILCRNTLFLSPRSVVMSILSLSMTCILVGMLIEDFVHHTCTSKSSWCFSGNGGSFNVGKPCRRHYLSILSRHTTRRSRSSSLADICNCTTKVSFFGPISHTWRYSFQYVCSGSQCFVQAYGFFGSRNGCDIGYENPILTDYERIF